MRSQIARISPQHVADFVKSPARQNSHEFCYARARARVLALSLALAIPGCKEADVTNQTKPDAAAPADPDDVPITEADVPMPPNYAEAVERLCGYHDAIRQALDSGHFHDAHRPLDETNIAVERLPGVARSSGIPRRDWEEVVTASEDLREALDEIHAQIDAGGTPDYAPHAAMVDGALARLKAITETNRKHGPAD